VTTFTKPTLPAAPEGWSVFKHGDDGDHYFQNNVGKCATQWHHPHDPDPNDQSSAAKERRRLKKRERLELLKNRAAQEEMKE